MKSQLLILIPLLFLNQVFAETFVSGSVSGVWTLEGSPYIPTGTLVIEAGETLLIEQGVRVEFRNAHLMAVYGVLDCNSEPDNPIFFTQDTITYPTRWQGIQFANSTNDVSTLRHVIIENASTYDGAIRVLGTSPIMESCKLREISGYAIRVFGQSFELLNCTISSNGRGGGCGAALRADNSDITIRNSQISLNTALDGGALCVYDCSLLVDSTDFFGNKAQVWGGVVYADNSTLEFRNCVFDSNLSIIGGVGYIIDASQATFDHCVFSRNASSHDGYQGNYGALYIPADGPHRMSNCLFYRNNGAINGAMYVLGNATIENCVFVENSVSPIIGGGIDTIRYTAFHSRPAGIQGGVPPGFAQLNSVNINGDSIDVYGNLFTLPDFDPNGPYGEFSLSFESHLIDAGNPDGPPDADGTIPDLGPYPYYQLQRIDDLTLTRLNDTNSLRLQWTAVPDAASYWVYRSPSGEFSMETAIFLGSDPATEFVDIDVLANPYAQGTYVVIASQTSATSAEPLLHRRLADR